MGPNRKGWVFRPANLGSLGVEAHPIHMNGGSLDGTGASKMRKPTALVCGLEDDLALENTRNDFRQATVPIWYGEMRGGGHGSGPFDGIPATIAWLRWHLGGETERKDMFIGEGQFYFNRGIWISHSKNWENYKDPF